MGAFKMAYAVPLPVTASADCKGVCFNNCSGLELPRKPSPNVRLQATATRSLGNSELLWPQAPTFGDSPGYTLFAARSGEFFHDYGAGRRVSTLTSRIHVLGAPVHAVTTWLYVPSSFVTGNRHWNPRFAIGGKLNVLSSTEGG